MKQRTILSAFFAGIGILALFPNLVMLFMPAERMESAIGSALEREGYAYHSEGLRKSFPLRISFANITISDERGPLLKIDDASARLELLPLLSGKIVVECQARMGHGEGKAEYQPRTGEMEFNFAGVRLEEVPLFRTTGYGDLRGVLAIEGSFSGNGPASRGELRMTVKDADFRGVRIGNVPLPDATFETVRGKYRTAGREGTLESLAFQGDGIYLRIRGRIASSHPPASSPLDLSLDLMPKPEFMERQKMVFLALARYRTSPGVYRIPIGGTLGMPVIR